MHQIHRMVAPIRFMGKTRCTGAALQGALLKRPAAIAAAPLSTTARAKPSPACYLRELENAVDLFGEDRVEIIQPHARSLTLVHNIYPTLERLLEAYITQYLSCVSDLTYDADIAKALLPRHDFSDLLKCGPHANEYVVRAHMRELLVGYIRTVNAARPIAIHDTARWTAQMEKLGHKVNTAWDQAQTQAQAQTRIELHWPWDGDTTIAVTVIITVGAIMIALVRL